MEPLKSTKEAADLIQLKAQTLRKYRGTGEGPAFVSLAPNRVAYRTSDLEAWVESRKRTSTADPGPSRAA